MKKQFFFSAIIAFVFSTSIYAQEITFTEKVIDYGTQTKGSDGARFFTFTNTGNSALIISKAKGSCGCTVATWPQEPIMPGATAKIPVRYDTNRVGMFTKSISVTTNDPKQKTVILSIKGNIVTEESAVPQKESTVFK